jgi:hypothetical protein
MRGMTLPGIAMSLMVMVTATEAQVSTESTSMTFENVKGDPSAGKLRKKPAGQATARPAARGDLKAKPHVAPGIEGTDVTTGGYTSDPGGDGCTPKSRAAQC